jgi:hypothetical protein
MNPSPGLSFVTGPMGAGKSYFVTKKIAHALMAGKYVVTNIALMEGWSHRIARHTPQAWFSGSFSKRAKFYESLFIYTDDVESAVMFRPPGRGEARAIFAWDEAHNDLNNRNWNHESEKDKHSHVIKVATQLRKLGYVGYWITQHEDNTDAALRRIMNWHIRLRNQRESVRVMGMRICPVPFFLACYFPGNMPRVTTRRGSLGYEHIERYFLGWEKKLYNTYALYHGLYEDLGTDVIDLPKPGEATPEMLREWARSRLDKKNPPVSEGIRVEPNAEVLALRPDAESVPPLNGPRPAPRIVTSR